MVGLTFILMPTILKEHGLQQFLFSTVIVLGLNVLSCWILSKSCKHIHSEQITVKSMHDLIFICFEDSVVFFQQATNLLHNLLMTVCFNIYLISETNLPTTAAINIAILIFVKTTNTSHILKLGLVTCITALLILTYHSLHQNQIS